MTGIQVETVTVTVTDDQLEHACTLVRNNPALGHALALRQAGVTGTKGQLNEHVDAHEEILDALTEARHGRIRKELLHRAIDGDEETVYNAKGDPVGTRTVKSDRLMDLVARLYLPEARILQRGHVEVTGAGGGPVTVVHERRLTLADVFELAERLRGLGDSTRGQLPAARPVLPAPD